MFEHVVMFSGGAGSWGAARRIADQHGTDNLALLFTDTNIEDEDLYRFLKEAAEDVGGTLIWIDNEGKTPWDVFRDVRFLGNTRIAACSHKLKQEPAKQWVNENCDPDVTTLYVGIDWTEEHRLQKVKNGWEPYTVEAPLCEKPFVTKDMLLDEMRARGIEPPRLYGMGFPHNNCGGGCVKAGQAHFKLLAEKMPGRFKEWQDNEQSLRDFLDKDVSILRDRSGGTTKTLTLAELGARIELEKAQESGQLSLIDGDEWGGCGCFIDEE